MKKRTYWKSLKLKDGKIVSDHDGSEWKVNEWRSVPAPERECIGLNCCEFIADAMRYVNMDILAEVEISGKMITGDDKITCEKMRIIRAWQWEKKDSVEMAIYAAELVIEKFEMAHPDDSRPRNAINAAKAWITNPGSDTHSASAAYSAAYSAASAASAASASAAYSAAYSAASAASAASAYSAASAAYSAASAVKKQTKVKIQKWITGHILELKPVIS